MEIDILLCSELVVHEVNQIKHQKANFSTIQTPFPPAQKSQKHKNPLLIHLNSVNLFLNKLCEKFIRKRFHWEDQELSKLNMLPHKERKAR